MKKIFSFLCAALLMFHIYGCVGLWIGAGAVGGASAAVWAEGKLKHTLDVPLKEAFEATKVALMDMDCTITKSTVEEKVAQIRGKYSDEREIWIDIHFISIKRSEIVIRVGVTGDADASRLILDKVIALV
ncbi:MAG: DUF3568 family protein [Candidatus Omnitrophota bacterium]